jgi:hypothetical protein
VNEISALSSKQSGSVIPNVAINLPLSDVHEIELRHFSIKHSGSFGELMVVGSKRLKISPFTIFVDALNEIV